MKVEVIMPQMGESIVEGTVVEWLKAVGDAVKRDEDIFTISTDKVDAEIPSPAAGVLVEILAEVGETVEVGHVCAYIETEADAAAEPPAAAAEPADPEPDASPKKAVAEKTAPKKEAAQKSAPPKAEPDTRPIGERSKEELRRQRSTPLVRKIAAEHGIDDLSMIDGTGVSGRVTKKDIMAFIKAGVPPKAEKPAPSRAGAPMAPKLDLGDLPAGWEPALVKAPRVHIYEHDRVEPMSRMRASIAQNMIQSRRGTAHCHTLWEADMSAVVKARNALKAEYAERGVKLTFTAFFVAAVVDALREYPLMNAAIDGNTIVYRGSVNVGVAAAIEEGLIVPVVKNADSLNLLGIARAVNDLAERSKNKDLRPSDVADGTFTISNAGIFGSLVGIPILVPPQVGILGIGGIKKRVTADEENNIRVRSVVTMCLTFDHRLVDGAVADGFMRHVTTTLGEWSGT